FYKRYATNFHGGWISAINIQLMLQRTKKIQFIYFIYWILLAYITAALIFWFISLQKQNSQMADFKMQELIFKKTSSHPAEIQKINIDRKRKTTQYIGEGVSFFLVILAGAIFIFRAVRRQLKQSVQQQNFMIAVTHELKTPIAVAQLNLETLQKHKLTESQQQRLIQNTLQETIRLNALCNNMLLTSQIDAGGYRLTPEEINLSALVEKSIEDFSNRFPQTPFINQVQPGISITADDLLLQMAVNNLLDNAIKYSPKTTPVTISLLKKQLITLQVENEGQGISDDDKKKVFKKFYRAGNPATKAAKGTGLGLYLICKVAKAHHGTIVITDKVPAGVVVTLQLNSIAQNEEI
ncbi:MAG: HAMP domain-containing sensor histidine kinase, partial [Ferruginibacter sp.]